MKQSNDELEWHVIYEGSGNYSGSGWIEDVAHLGNEKWLLRPYDDPAWSFEPEDPIDPEEKTSDGLVDWVRSIDSASDEDSSEKPENFMHTNW